MSSCPMKCCKVYKLWNIVAEGWMWGQNRAHKLCYVVLNYFTWRYIYVNTEHLLNIFPCALRNEQFRIEYCIGVDVTDVLSSVSSHVYVNVCLPFPSTAKFHYNAQTRHRSNKLNHNTEMYQISKTFEQPEHWIHITHDFHGIRNNGTVTQ